MTTPETATAMVAAVAAAGYLALQQKQQQRDHHQQQQQCGDYLHHHHQQCGTPGVVVQGASPGTVAVPSASAAAVAAAAAATAIATQQHAPLSHRVCFSCCFCRIMFAMFCYWLGFSCLFHLLI